MAHCSTPVVFVASLLVIDFSSLRDFLPLPFGPEFYNHAAKWQTDLMGLFIPFQGTFQACGSPIPTARALVSFLCPLPSGRCQVLRIVLVWA